MTSAEAFGQVPDCVPRCAHCGHRRIFHYEMVLYSRDHNESREKPVPCSLPGCRCREYDPASAAYGSTGGLHAVS